METIRLGILTWRNGRRFEEKTYFAHLTQMAEKMGIEVFVFSPNDVLSDGKIRGLRHVSGKGWMERLCPPPDVVYDRFRNMSPAAFRSFVRFREKCDWTFLNSRTAHKWNLYRFLRQHKQISRWLPETIFLEQPRDVLSLLKKYDSVYLKPVNGTGGKGILSISKKDGQYRAIGRDFQRKKVTKRFRSFSALAPFIQNWTRHSKYVAQQGLDLEWEPGVVTDFRLLVQKNERGQWSITGLGGKIGQKNSATSNLHSGGKAIDPTRFFSRYLPADKIKKIVAECEQLGLLAAEYIEDKFGRLVELGIDLGIDTSGDVWIIEINNKPGREIFKQMGDPLRYKLAVRRPLEFARFAHERKGDD